MATIGDVAQYAGVSRSTVSHALSGKRPISLATRERINEAIAALNFTPNAGAKALATSKSSIMGLIVPFTPEEFAPATMQYVLVVSETARSLGYDVLMVTEVDGARGITRVTDSNLVDGVLLLDVKRHDDRVASVLEARQPGVLVGFAEGNDSLDSIDLDFGAAGKMLVQHLFDNGHRTIIFITFPQELFAQDVGFAWRFRDAAVSAADELQMSIVIVYGDTDPATRYKVVGEALDLNPTATALLVHNEGALVDLPMLLAERQLSVPQDLSVVSVFPDQFGGMFSLPYTAIEASPRPVAARAVHLLAARIADSDRPVVSELLEPVLIDRGSSRAI
ncbi:MAG TPA: LacI family DNA-binding transcriptional regulator [Galbitalea sp.]|jgi:DNA-binding LacI/PurR family transcriptional regulator|nr:LacI family DNA-binding transcriptional regulator [Galbitalea sp.]